MSQSAYNRGLRAGVNALWSGVWDFNQFFDHLQTLIRRELTLAWAAGAAEMGIFPDELTPDELIARQSAITRETTFITGLGLFVEENSKARGVKRSVSYARLRTWYPRWLDVKNQARLMVQGDPKLKWILGVRKKHCRSCTKLASKVKRQSTWNAVGVRPQNPPNPLLDCGGYD